MRQRLSPLAAVAAALACSGPATPARPALPDGHAAAAAALERARAAQAAGDAAEARLALAQAVAFDPEWELPRCDLAELLLREDGDAAGAQRLLDAPGGRDDNPRRQRLRGQALEQAGEEWRAADAYRRSLELRDDTELRLRRGLILARTGPRAEAIAELERVREVRPGELLARRQLAELYEAVNRRAEAEAELTFQAAWSPADPAPLRQLAAFLARAGDPARAAQAEQAARALEPPARALRPLKPDGVRR